MKDHHEAFNNAPAKVGPIKTNPQFQQILARGVNTWTLIKQKPKALNVTRPLAGQIFIKYSMIKPQETAQQPSNGLPVCVRNRGMANCRQPPKNRPRHNGSNAVSFCRHVDFLLAASTIFGHEFTGSILPTPFLRSYP